MSRGTGAAPTRFPELLAKAYDHATVLAGAVAVGCALVVTLRVAFAPGPTLARRATEAELSQVARSIASSERGWTKVTTQNFPQDDWSQRDDFHGREGQEMRARADEKGIRIEDVLRAVDDDIHRAKSTSPDAPDGRHARAVPCKPRPFYD